MEKIVVVGGGVAGIAMGLFAKQKGLHIPVYEQSSKEKSRAHVIWIASNGMALLEKLGVIDEIKSCSTPQTEMLFTSSWFDPCMRLDSTQLSKSLGHSIWAIHRKDLYQILLNAFLKTGGEIHFDQHLESLDCHSKGVELCFKNQEQPVSCQYVIAADGIGSVTRKICFPEAKVIYQCIRTYLGHSKTDVSQHFVGKTIEAWGKHTRFVLTSLDGKTTHWSALKRCKEYENHSVPMPKNLSQFLRNSFSEYHPYIQEILACMDETQIQRCNFGVVSGLPKYHNERVCLIGDAAHGMPPNMGQGASLALEDAYCLVNLLVQNNQTFLGAVRQWEKVRRPRVKKMVNLSTKMNTYFQPDNSFLRVIRDHLIPLIPNVITQKQTEHLYKFSDPTTF